MVRECVDLFVDTRLPLLCGLFPFHVSSSLSPKLRKQLLTFVNFLAYECPILWLISYDRRMVFVATKKGANTRGRLTPRQWMSLADEEENDRSWMDMTADDTVS